MKKEVDNIYKVLNSEERKHTKFMVFLMILTGMTELLSVISIMPFMSIAANPDLIVEDEFYAGLYVATGSDNATEFTYYLGFGVFFAILVTQIVKTISTYFQNKFVTMSEYRLGKRFIEMYLSQDYEWFLGVKMSDLSKNILSEINIYVLHGLQPLINLFSYGTIALFIVLMLVIYDIELSLIVGSVFLVSYLMAYKVSSSYIKKIGAKRKEANQKRFKSIVEVFEGIKEVKVNSLENKYINEYSRPAEEFARYQANAQIIGMTPRYFVELIAMGGAIVLVLFLMSESGSNLTDALPVIALYVFAGFKLLPVAQQMYTALTQIKFSGKIVNDLTEEVKQLGKNKSRADCRYNRSSLTKVEKGILVQDVEYRYSRDSDTVLKGMSFNLGRGKLVCFWGKSGTGKTTMIDIISGLIKPSRGSVLFDGEDVIEKGFAWLKEVAYAPQKSHIFNETISQNIALNDREPSMKKIIDAAKLAHAHDFIMALPKKYDTVVGGGLIGLSGGQAQRIGLARMFYKDNSVVILDESTSAIDKDTSIKIIKNVRERIGERVVIIITHDDEIRSLCDEVVSFNDRGFLK